MGLYVASLTTWSMTMIYSFARINDMTHEEISSTFGTFGLTSLGAFALKRAARINVEDGNGDNIAVAGRLVSNTAAETWTKRMRLAS